jgi:hypothetical protein
MNLVDVYAWATQPDKNAALCKQLAAAVAVAAVQVLSEVATYPNHANRLLWAKRVLLTPAAPLAMADQMVWGVLGNATVQGELAATPFAVPDGDMQFVVSTLIDVYSP